MDQNQVTHSRECGATGQNCKNLCNNTFMLYIIQYNSMGKAECSGANHIEIKKSTLSRVVGGTD